MASAKDYKRVLRECLPERTDCFFARKPKLPRFVKELFALLNKHDNMGYDEHQLMADVIMMHVKELGFKGEAEEKLAWFKELEMFDGLTPFRRYLVSNLPMPSIRKVVVEQVVEEVEDEPVRASADFYASGSEFQLFVLPPRGGR